MSDDNSQIIAKKLTKSVENEAKLKQFFLCYSH